MDRKLLTLNILSGLIIAILTYLILQQDNHFYVSVGNAIGYKRLLIILLLLLLLLISLIYLIIRFNIIRKNNAHKKANVFIRLYNRIYYPKYIRYKDMMWKVNKDDKNVFQVSKYPFCKICEIPILCDVDQFDNRIYYCGECELEYKDSDFSIDYRVLLNTLNTKGIKYFRENSKLFKHINGWEKKC